MAVLKIHCLGGLSFSIDNMALESLKSRKGQALLCYLAVNRKPYTRSALAGLLWPEMPEEHARTNLRKTLQRMHVLLAPGGRFRRKAAANLPGFDLRQDRERVKSFVIVSDPIHHFAPASAELPRGHVKACLLRHVLPFFMELL